MPLLRLVTTSDAAELASLQSANRNFLAHWDPTRAEAFFTEAGQRESIDRALAGFGADLGYPAVICDDGAVVGRVTLFGIERGPFQSARVGYWLAESATGRGLARQALGELVRIAFVELGLHRLEAATLLDNRASQRVLAANGFTRFGRAPGYTKIAGRWQEHDLFQRLNE